MKTRWNLTIDQTEQTTTTDILDNRPEHRWKSPSPAD